MNRQTGSQTPPSSQTHTVTNSPPRAQSCNSPIMSAPSLNKPITATRHTLPNRSPSTTETTLYQDIGSPTMASSSSSNTLFPSIASPIIPSMSPRTSFLPSLNKMDYQPHSSISSNASSSRSRKSSISGGTLSPENLIDVMEKEQEGIVLKLMKEIQGLKDENKQLRQQLSKFIPNNSSSGGSISSNSTNSSSLSRSSTQRRSTVCGSTASAKRLPSVSSMSIPSSYLDAHLQASSQSQSQQVPINTNINSSDLADVRNTKNRRKGNKNRRKSADPLSFSNYSFSPVGRNDSFSSDKLMEGISPLSLHSAEANNIKYTTATNENS